jgi:dihydrofolate reductase
MGKVVFDTSMSLDGFMTAADQTAEEPMGAGGLRLMEWLTGPDDRGRELLAGWVADLGASIAGRRTYDSSLRWWGADGPSGSARRPLFVVTHAAPADAPEDGVYSFVTDGIVRALELAQSAAEGRTVTIMGGADIGRQYLAAGLVDEISLHLAPVLLGRGTRMFEDLGIGPLDLELTEAVDTAAAVHLRYRIADRNA